MQITDELIELFFQKRCMPEQAMQVADYLKTNPLVLDKFLNKHEWNVIDAITILPEEFWSEAWAGIQKKKRKQALILSLKRTVIAACIILLVTAGFFYLSKSGKIVQQPVTTNVLPVLQQQTTRNTTKNIVNIVLHDSSVIKLSPAAVIRYANPFQNNKRDIYLEGEAFFKVAKDKTKPFTVYAGGLATVALGTSFSIKTNSQNNVTIKLFTGKIVIKSINNNLSKWKDVYLLPGNEMRYNASSQLTVVETIETRTHNKTIVSPSENLKMPGGKNPQMLINILKYFRYRKQCLPLILR